VVIDSEAGPFRVPDTSPHEVAVAQSRPGFWKRHTRWRGFFQLIVIWLINTAALMMMIRIIPGARAVGIQPPLFTALTMAILNALLWPLMVRFLLPLGVLTLGLGPLLLNGVIVLWAADNDENVVDSIFSAILIALGVTVINTFLTTILALNDVDFYYRRGMRRRAKRLRGKNAKNTDVPGVIFLEVDGLSHDVLRRAIRDGNAATAGSWHRNGHRLMSWECDWSSQTSGCQAGLLHGNNHDIPGFRWWEKERSAPMVSNHPVDAMALERRLSDGNGLLAFGGASRANLLSGDAPHTLLTMSTVLKKRGKTGQDYWAYFANPHSVTRTLMLAIVDIGVELWTSTQQRRRDVWPRVRRTVGYAFARAYTTVVQRDLQASAVVFDILLGRPVVYTTFLGYDEVAHHSGLERMSAIWVLRGVDRQFARIQRAVQDAPRPYHFVVLSDHGQTQGAPFRQRYGKTLEDLVRELTSATSLESQKQGTEGPGFLQASLTEVAKGHGPQAWIARHLSRQEADRSGRPPEVVVMASGCLGLISFPRAPGRLTLEHIEAVYPRLMEGLRHHPGIGFLLVRSARFGALAIGPEGINYIDEERVEGLDPLAPFGPNAAAKVRRTDRFEHCPDIVLNSTYWEGEEEVAAFEELVGSHGGMGGGQSLPFVLYPGDWSAPAQPIVGAEAMHRQLRRWLVEVGQKEHAAKLVSLGELHSAEAQGVARPLSNRHPTQDQEVQSA
jgi:uncharacterized membrane protein YvlD (DUF360 family)